jgi:pyruvate formate lyase activating enzyme
MSVPEVMVDIERDLPFYDESGGGVTFSGGEPLHQPDFLQALASVCKEKEIQTALDTCGYASWEVVDEIRDYVDLFLYDLKFIDDARHREYTGVSNEPILRNLRMLAERGHQIILRVPVIPGINDDESNIRQIGDLVATIRQSNGARIHQVDLLPYHHIAVEKYQRLNKTYALAEVRPPSEERMGEIAQILRGFDLFVKIGG